MNKDKFYVVCGGIYKDTTFAEIEPGTKEIYGPFETYDDAYSIWNAKSRIKMDICCHRLVIDRV